MTQLKPEWHATYVLTGGRRIEYTFGTEAHAKSHVKSVLVGERLLEHQTGPTSSTILPVSTIVEVKIACILTTRPNHTGPIWSSLND